MMVKDLFWINAFQTKFNTVVAICDEEVLGKTLRFKNFKVQISKKFYCGKLADENIAVKALGKATIGNLFGNKIIDIAEKNGFITKENIIFIDEIPHAQFVKLKEQI